MIAGKYASACLIFFMCYLPVARNIVYNTVSYQEIQSVTLFLHY